jgi:predicted RNase H-like nuclease (RuvC/YqgF family)
MEVNTMRTNNKLILCLVLVAPVLLAAGCSDRKQAQVAVRPDDPLAKYWNDNVKKRFQEPAPKGTTAVESAIELSEKYAKLSEETAALKQSNQDLTAKNKQIQKQAASLEAQLQQTQKELSQANDLLVEMRVELNNWKTNVLGFRDEMRQAQATQLEALLKILKVLGGQPVESANAENTGPPVASLSNPEQAKTVK